MNRTEVKELLKNRKLMLNLYKKLYINSTNNSTNCVLYKSNRDNIAEMLCSIDKELLKYCKESAVGNWLLNIKGMTPNIAAALLAYFNVTYKNCAAQFIKFAGADCESSHNNDVKDIMNELLHNFKYEPKSLYGKLNKDKFIELTNQSINISTAHIRADRYTKKLFISHLFEEMYREEYNTLPERYNKTNSVIIEPEVPYTKMVGI